MQGRSTLTSVLNTPATVYQGFHVLITDRQWTMNSGCKETASYQEWEECLINSSWDWRWLWANILSKDKLFRKTQPFFLGRLFRIKLIVAEGWQMLWLRKIKYLWYLLFFVFFAFNKPFHRFIIKAKDTDGSRCGSPQQRRRSQNTISPVRISSKGQSVWTMTSP